MNEFIAIDFETGNPKRVSACALGIAWVSNGDIVDSKHYLIKPVGGHSPFQTKIHGIDDSHTSDKPYFDMIYPSIRDIFNYPLIGHSMFDKQVLNALSEHFNLRLKFTYTDSCAIATMKLPDLKNHKLNTLVKHFKLPAFNHHDAMEDAIACARIYLQLNNTAENADIAPEESIAFRSLSAKILEDDEISYKEAYELLYWLEDHPSFASNNSFLLNKIRAVLEDGILEHKEAIEVKQALISTLKKQVNTM